LTKKLVKTSINVMKNAKKSGEAEHHSQSRRKNRSMKRGIDKMRSRATTGAINSNATFRFTLHHAARPAGTAFHDSFLKDPCTPDSGYAT
jgi:hypothetical protein